jgi:hypothetical protein
MTRFFVQNCTPDTNASFNVKIGNLERAALGASEWLTCWMLKWVRWGKYEGKRGKEN